MIKMIKQSFVIKKKQFLSVFAASLSSEDPKFLDCDKKDEEEMLIDLTSPQQEN